MDFLLRESPAMIASVQEGSGSGNIPRMLEDLIAMGEAVAERGHGTSVQFRIRVSRFRSSLGVLKGYTNTTWYNSVEAIVEELNNCKTLLEVISQNLAD